MNVVVSGSGGQVITISPSLVNVRVEPTPQVQVFIAGRAGSNVVVSSSDVMKLSVVGGSKVGVNLTTNIVQNSITPLVMNLCVSTVPKEGADYGLVKKVAGEVIFAYRVVSLGSDGRIYLADKDNEFLVNRIIGVALSDGSIGSVIPVKVIGLVSNPNWAWFLDKMVYLGKNGQLTQNPESGFIVKIGNVIDEQTIFVDIDVIIRAL